MTDKELLIEVWNQLAHTNDFIAAHTNPIIEAGGEISEEIVEVGNELTLVRMYLQVVFEDKYNEQVYNHYKEN
jgi:hypothetical protein